MAPFPSDETASWNVPDDLAPAEETSPQGEGEGGQGEPPTAPRLTGRAANSIRTIILAVLRALHNPTEEKTRDQLVNETKFQRRRVSSSLGPYMALDVISEEESAPPERIQRLRRNTRKEAVISNVSAFQKYYFDLKKASANVYQQLMSAQESFVGKFGKGKNLQMPGPPLSAHQLQFIMCPPPTPKPPPSPPTPTPLPPDSSSLSSPTPWAQPPTPSPPPTPKRPKQAAKKKKKKRLLRAIIRDRDEDELTSSPSPPHSRAPRSAAVGPSPRVLRSSHTPSPPARQLRPTFTTTTGGGGSQVPLQLGSPPSTTGLPAGRASQGASGTEQQVKRSRTETWPEAGGEESSLPEIGLPPLPFEPLPDEPEEAGLGEEQKAEPAVQFPLLSVPPEPGYLLGDPDVPTPNNENYFDSDQYGALTETTTIPQPGEVISPGITPDDPFGQQFGFGLQLSTDRRLLALSLEHLSLLTKCEPLF
ncbi:hypothetical protein PAPYR_6085 [Paratrimastix pyriformis]|uniref:Uncharacterized protein n=1 Tax=Paratrimastix pyriformis TaxID=342808 RepID=A0ABQ8UNF2_9EUKA|nr:hypothetical protein PAPYR_6085 [Paratrimastix pyriformis]